MADQPRSATSRPVDRLKLFSLFGKTAAPSSPSRKRKAKQSNKEPVPTKRSRKAKTQKKRAPRKGQKKRRTAKKRKVSRK